MKTFDFFNEDDIPELPGVYCFYYRPFRLDNFGLTKYSSQHRNVDFKQIRIRIKNKLDKVNQVISYHQQYSGEIRNDALMLSSKSIFQISMKKNVKSELDSKINDLSDSELWDYLCLMDSTQFLSIPLYVGITTKQTLKDRYQQHKYNYNRNNPMSNTFGYRARTAGIKWSDMQFTCHFDEYINSDKSYKILEEQLLLLLEPIFSIR